MVAESRGPWVQTYFMLAHHRPTVLTMGTASLNPALMLPFLPSGPQSQGPLFQPSDIQAPASAPGSSEATLSQWSSAILAPSRHHAQRTFNVTGLPSPVTLLGTWPASSGTMEGGWWPCPGF